MTPKREDVTLCLNKFDVNELFPPMNLTVLCLFFSRGSVFFFFFFIWILLFFDERDSSLFVPLSRICVFSFFFIWISLFVSLYISLLGQHTRLYEGGEIHNEVTW